MQSRDFCFWLQGFFELSGEDAVLSAAQAAMIRRHLDMVFHHEIDPQAVEAKAPERPATPVPRPAAPSPQPDPQRLPVKPEPPQTPPPMC